MVMWRWEPECSVSQVTLKPRVSGSECVSDWASERVASVSEWEPLERPPTHPPRNNSWSWHWQPLERPLEVGHWQPLERPLEMAAAFKSVVISVSEPLERPSPYGLAVSLYFENRKRRRPSRWSDRTRKIDSKERRE